jgi:hypothetical protein
MTIPNGIVKEFRETFTVPSSPRNEEFSKETSSWTENAMTRGRQILDRRPTPNEVRAINRASNKARTNFVQCSRLVRALYEPKGVCHER